MRESVMSRPRACSSCGECKLSGRCPHVCFSIPGLIRVVPFDRENPGFSGKCSIYMVISLKLTNT